MTFQKAIKASEVPEEGVAKAVVGRWELAIIHHAGNFYAIDGVCTTREDRSARAPSKATSPCAPGIRDATIS